MTTMTRDPFTLLGALVTLLAMTSLCGGVKVFDLTLQLKPEEIITWPTNPKFNFTILHRGVHPLYNAWVEGNKFAMAEHMGTHMDAPSHLGGKGKWRMQNIPAEMLLGPGVVVDVKDKVKDNPAYQVTVKDLEEWESQHGMIPEKAIVLVDFGWASRYPDKKRVFNTNNLQDMLSFKFPSVSGEAATWLAEQRKIIALGTDTPSPDTGKDYKAPVHQILLGKNLLIVENVGSMHLMPPTGTTIVLGGISIWDGSGAPMRLLAFSGAWRPLGSWTPLPLAALSLGMTLVRRLLLVQ